VEDQNNKDTIISMLSTLRTVIDGPCKGTAAGLGAEEGSDDDSEDEEAEAELE